MLTFDQLLIISPKAREGYLRMRLEKAIQDNPKAEGVLRRAQALCDRAFGNSEQ